MENYLISSALVFNNENKILLVKHKPEFDSDFYWGLPSGTAKNGESIVESLERELLEETGLTVSKINNLAFCTQHINYKLNWQSLTMTFYTEVNDGTIKSNDPDEDILEASFFKIDDVLKLINENPFKIMREPLLDYLKNKKCKLWMYKETEKGVNLINSFIL